MLVIWLMKVSLFLSFFLLVAKTAVCLQLQNPPSPFEGPNYYNLSRRKALSSALVASLGGVLTTTPSRSAAVATAAVTDRTELLDAIDKNASDAVILDLIAKLPSSSSSSLPPPPLDGKWQLVWSYKAEAFSPLLKLPPPFRPTSYQYIGTDATDQVGAGRIAQVLTGGVLGGSNDNNNNNQLWLSSGAIPLSTDPSILEIQPPFRLEWGGVYTATTATPQRQQQQQPTAPQTPGRSR